MTSMKRIFVLVAAMAILVMMLGTATADHSHFVVTTHPVTGVRTCQYLAAGTSEPAAAHPLHTRVHTGQPGSDSVGSDFDKNANESARCDVVRR